MPLSTDSVMPLSTENSSNVNLISHAIQHLRQLTQVSAQQGWRSCLEDLSIATATQPSTWNRWQPVALNARDHIPWSKGRQVLWLGQRFTLPAELHGYPLHGLTLRLALTWWATAAQIFVNGVLVQEGDLFDCSVRVVLSTSVQPAEVISVALRLVSPGHDDGALVQSRFLYELPEEQVNAYPEPGFVADELAVLQQYLTTFNPNALDELADAVGQIRWDILPDRPAFDHSLSVLRQRLHPLGDWLKQRRIQLLGHAHLDMAWLWTVDETWNAAERTFKSVLELQQDFPELIFCHSSPALYDWIECHRPALFAAIQAQVAAGGWEVVAGFWVEPDLNLISGEALVRQVLYGQRYGQEKFGRVSAIAWVPDSFGFCWQLPQILIQGGVTYFVTQKLRWNDTHEFPYDLFWWQAPDGSQILSLNSAVIGEGIDPLKMTRYACTWEEKTGIPSALWLPGVGDHGGGPTRDMLAIARRWQQSPFFPQLEFTTATAYLQTMASREEEGKHASAHPLPTWNDELYLEFHRGCYTTHADQKRWNRRCEGLLYQAELFASLATLVTGVVYPYTAIASAWKQVLFNQFHDILPGSSIPEVFADANHTWMTVEQEVNSILQSALEAIATHITSPTPPHSASYPVLILNSLNWERSEVVSVPLPHPATPGKAWQICDLTGQVLPSQERQQNGSTIALQFQATEVPGIGYRLFWLSLLDTSAPGSEAGKESSDWVLENDLLRVEVDPHTGNLHSVFDKVHQRQVLSAPGNQLQAFQDSGQYWDAWNIDPDYAQHPLSAPVLTSMQWLERGAIAQRLQIVRQLGNSPFYQVYGMYTGSAVLTIETTVDWQERQVLVKAAFPLNLIADYATYEIPFAAIQRPTQSANPQDHAKWEVPALQWADLGDANYGMSVLNDCKYGYDSQPSQLRLTLLRSPNWPDPNADQGDHQFTYALYPHAQSWTKAQTVRRGYELNQPLKVMVLPPEPPSNQTTLAPIGQFLNVEAENLVMTAFKPAEDETENWVLRLYECHGEPAEFQGLGDGGAIAAHHLNLTEPTPVNLLEQPIGDTIQTREQLVSIAPWKIVSFKFAPKPSVDP